jgi:TRAP-type C4-dicarboxylate transport system substrate-binding protein
MSAIRNFVFVAGVALVLASAPAGAQNSAPTKWSLPSAYTADNFHNENLGLFAKDVADATGGKLAITLYPGASLFSATQIKSAVRIGQAQAGELLISLHDGEDPIYGVDVIPFLATSYQDARKLWAASKSAISKRFDAQGLTPLFAVPWPPQGIYAKKEITQVGDMRGLSWRVYNSGTQRIAQLVGAFPVTIQAADLQQALSTGLINAFMTSSATGYDSKAWETMSYFYDTQAWIPKNITFVNKAAFEQLDRPTQDAVMRTAALAEARGWQRSQERTRWYLDQLAGNGMKVRPPGEALKAGLQQVGERLTGEWLQKTGGEGLAVIEAYRKPSL